MPANKRDKASDVFNSTDYAFCSKVSFSEAFPHAYSGVSGRRNRNYPDTKPEHPDTLSIGSILF